MPHANTVYADGRIIVPTPGEADSLYQDGYGRRQGTLILTPSEALYLVEKERIAVIDEGEKRILTFQEILHRELHRDKLLWTTYIVYRDIRGRGFVAKTPADSTSTFLVYERGTYPNKPPCYEIHIIYEGMNETIGDLEKVLKQSNESGRLLKLAVIDRRGEIVYYGLERAELGSKTLDN